MDDVEFSMTQVGEAFLRKTLDREPTPEETESIVSVYIEEWNTGVHPLPHIASFIGELSERFRLAVVTNTHRADLVPNHLRAMGILEAFDAVITSVEVGRRKPHPEIYAVTLERLGIVVPENAVFVGDSYGPDYEGPERAGIRSYLIDPGKNSSVPEDRRLDSVFDLGSRLA